MPSKLRAAIETGAATRCGALRPEPGSGHSSPASRLARLNFQPGSFADKNGQMRPMIQFLRRGAPSDRSGQPRLGLGLVAAEHFVQTGFVDDSVARPRITTLNLAYG